MLSFFKGMRAVSRKSIRRVVVVAAVVGCSAGEPDQQGSWGTTDVVLSAMASGAMVKFLASGSCYGSYGTITQAIPSGAFSLPGTYTQLIGAYPGSLQYPAEYVGTVIGRRMTLSIHVAELQQVFGPYQLNFGVEHTWSACLYP